jgi:hypothetical protein
VIVVSKVLCLQSVWDAALAYPFGWMRHIEKDRTAEATIADRRGLGRDWDHHGDDRAPHGSDGPTFIRAALAPPRCMTDALKQVLCTAMLQALEQGQVGNGIRHAIWRSP